MTQLDDRSRQIVLWLVSVSSETESLLLAAAQFVNVNFMQRREMTFD